MEAGRGSHERTRRGTAGRWRRRGRRSRSAVGGDEAESVVGGSVYRGDVRARCGVQFQELHGGRDLYFRSGGGSVLGVVEVDEDELLAGLTDEGDDLAARAKLPGVGGLV